MLSASGRTMALTDGAVYIVDQYIETADSLITTDCICGKLSQFFVRLRANSFLYDSPDLLRYSR